jgi:hypothetical protein
MSVSPISASYPYGQSITFSGTATDAEDGNISAKIIWNSSLDGTIGTGATISRTLSAGTHTITASATDSAGTTGKATMNLSINPNTAPSVSISVAPVSASYFSNQTITFTGTATDTEDGNISAKIAWSSSLDGVLGTGQTISKILSAGTHLVTASVKDSASASGNSTAQVIVKIFDAPPSLSITVSPVATSYDYGTAITFTGTALDPEDGSISGKITWVSDVDGNLGTGATSVTSTLSAATHNVKASIGDSAGNSTSSSVTVVVKKLNNGLIKRRK